MKSKQHLLSIFILLLALTISVTVQANDPPVADPDGPYTAATGSSVSFDGSSSFDSDGTIVAYDWDFGDGNTGTGVNPTNTYATAGTYTVTLTVSDDGGASDSASSTADIGGVDIDIDIKPGSCPNPFNSKSKGSVPVAITGSVVYLGSIDLDSLLLASVPIVPGSVLIADVTQPGDYNLMNCYDCFNKDDYLTDPDGDGVFTYEGDGHLDLVVKFDTQALAVAIEEAPRGECVELTLTGVTLGGDLIELSDSMVIKTKIKIKD